MTIRKLLIAGTAVAAVFGGTYGLAASLGLTSDSLGAGQAVVASCQSTAMNATYTSAYSSTVPGYTTTTVTVTGLTSSCYGKAYRLTLSDASNASLVEVTGTLPGSGTSFATTATSVSASAVTGVSLVVSG